MAIEYFCCYHSYRKKCEKLTDQELGRLFRSLMIYSETGERQDLAGRESIAFDFIADDIDRNRPKDTSGKNHWNWKGGVTPENQRQRSSAQAKAWRNAVFERDNYICQLCGKQGGKLNAHHIKSWAKHTDLRFEVENGITLCEKCHRQIHKTKR